MGMVALIELEYEIFVAHIGNLLRVPIGVRSAGPPGGFGMSAIRLRTVIAPLLSHHRSPGHSHRQSRLHRDCTQARYPHGG